MRVRGDQRAAEIESALRRDYEGPLARVGEARRALADLLARGHSPEQLRGAVRQVNAATDTASRTISRAMAEVGAATRRRRGLARVVPVDMQPWAGEMVRLSEIREWARQAVITMTGTRVPNAPKTYTTFATGPRVPGIVVAGPGDEARAIPELDIRATVDRVTAGWAASDRELTATPRRAALPGSD